MVPQEVRWPATFGPAGAGGRSGGWAQCCGIGQRAVDMPSSLARFTASR